LRFYKRQNAGRGTGKCAEALSLVFWKAGEKRFFVGFGFFVFQNAKKLLLFFRRQQVIRLR